MNEDAFNVSLRKFLKKVGITSQREIEQAVRAAIAARQLKPRGTSIVVRQPAPFRLTCRRSRGDTSKSIASIVTGIDV